MYLSAGFLGQTLDIYGYLFAILCSSGLYGLSMSVSGTKEKYTSSRIQMDRDLLHRYNLLGKSILTGSSRECIVMEDCIEMYREIL